MAWRTQQELKSSSWYWEECRAIREPSGKNHFIYNLSNSTSHTANRFAFGLELLSDCPDKEHTVEMESTVVITKKGHTF